MNTEITTEVAAYLRSAEAHPEKLAVMTASDLRDQMIDAGLVVPFGYGRVMITEKGSAVLAERLQQLADVGCPHD